MRNKECDVYDRLRLHTHNAKVGHNSIDTNRKNILYVSGELAEKLAERLQAKGLEPE
ncbi:hypothetical protein [Nostoc sp.]